MSAQFWTTMASGRHRLSLLAVDSRPSAQWWWPCVGSRVSRVLSNMPYASRQFGATVPGTICSLWPLSKPEGYLCMRISLSLGQWMMRVTRMRLQRTLMCALCTLSQRR